MPAIRVLGNAGLSFFTKLSSGYWNIFDPTNGYTAVHRVALELLPLGKIDRRFFFESDMLFRLNLAGAVVVDIPMRAIYADETSNLKVSRIFFAFLGKNLRNFAKRIFYRYFLRDLNLGSLELVVGTLLLGFGTIFGATQWIAAVATEQAASAGTVMLSGLPVLAGIQFLIGFFSFDLTSVPRIPLIRLLGTERKPELSAAPRQVATG